MGFLLQRKKMQLRLFGNSLAFHVNFMYFLQHCISRLFSKNLQVSDSTHKKRASELKRDGFTKAAQVNVDKISEIVNDYFQKNPVTEGMGIMDRKASAVLAPYICEALSGPVESVINSYYGSHFQFYWITVTRYQGAISEKLDGSFYYHTDDNPKSLMKVFFYLQDTTESNSAFRTFNYETSQELFNQGFISCETALRMESQKFITPELEREKLQVLEGKKGTVLFFDNNLVHRAAEPKVHYRDTINIEIYPHYKRFNEEAVRKALTVPYVYDWPKNPFVNDLQIANLANSAN